MYDNTSPRIGLEAKKHLDVRLTWIQTSDVNDFEAEVAVLVLDATLPLLLGDAETGRDGLR